MENSNQPTNSAISLLSPPSPKVKASNEMPAIAHNIGVWRCLEPLATVLQHLWISCVTHRKLAVHLFFSKNSCPQKDLVEILGYTLISLQFQPLFISETMNKGRAMLCFTGREVFTSPKEGVVIGTAALTLNQTPP